MSERTESIPAAGGDLPEDRPESPDSAQEQTVSQTTDTQDAGQVEREGTEPAAVSAGGRTDIRERMPELDDGTPGWHMESPEPEGPAERGPRPAIGTVFTRVSLGSALLAMDALNERLELVEDAEDQAVQEPRNLDSVLVPEGEWEERFGQAPGLAARHLALGVAIDTRTKVGKGLGFLNSVGNTTVRALDFVFEPITSSRFFRPVKKRFYSSVNRGQNQVNYWMNIGRAEEVRSRHMAETALTNVVDESMDELVDNLRVQEFVQEMLAAQSLGMIDEAIEEIRERAVSSDAFFEIPFRRLFRRGPRRSIPGPDFDRRLVRPLSKRNLSIDQGSLLGYYAGFTSRMLALALDVGLIMLFVVMTGWLFQTIGQILGDSPMIKSLALTEEMFSLVGAILSSLNAITIIVGYAFVFWILTGQTPGMMLMGIRVVSIDGKHLSFWRSVRRLIGYIISIAFLFLGFIWVLFDDRRQGWHDKLAGTYVVYSWDAHPDETFLTSQM
ncbi:MAG TPA: RDD family protein [candidate division Zixibacteria bacterium]|nr:RDD family protein [candidate division Zixibacteria bacterium]